ncbi:protein FAM237B [Elgaria multicarinata webbii]|uniref:protein FAM237B n=1 Tax=Elgaria multicarinata webbii TaxID=159646 RepID=UPI002FCCDEB9
MTFSLRRWYLQLGCLLMVNLVYGILEYQKEAPASLGEIDNQCWEISSLRLVEMKKLRVEGTVTALWEFMMFLKESSKPKHNEVFNNLAQNFWDMYIDCVLSRSHGMGRRQLEFPVNTFTHAPKISKDSVLCQELKKEMEEKT